MTVILLSCGPFALLAAAVVLRIAAVSQPEAAAVASRRDLLIWVSYFLLAISVFGMLFLVFAVGAAGVIGFILTILLVVSMTEAEIRVAGVRNRARQSEFLWVLAIAMKSGRPLSEEIEAYARGTGGRRHRQLMAMAERLSDGDPLTEIVVPQGLIPPSALMQIHAGITSQSLQNSLNETANRVTQELVEDQESGCPGAGLFYPAALIPIAFFIVAFLMYYIVPKFKKIFDDFGTQLPGVTTALIVVSDTVANSWILLGLPLFYVPLGVFLFVTTAEYYGWRTILQTILGRWFVRWHSPDVLRALSQGIAHGIPIDQALMSIVKHAGPLKLRERLAMAVDAMEAGAPSWQSLQQAGILNAYETIALEAAEKSSNLPWAMRTLATTIESRWMFRLRAIFEFIQPAILVAVAIVVAFIAIAIFMPLIKLLNDLS